MIRQNNNRKYRESNISLDRIGCVKNCHRILAPFAWGKEENGEISLFAYADLDGYVHILKIKKNWNEKEEKRLAYYIEEKEKLDKRFGSDMTFSFHNEKPNNRFRIAVNYWIIAWIIFAMSTAVLGIGSTLLPASFFRYFLFALLLGLSIWVGRLAYQFTFRPPSFYRYRHSRYAKLTNAFYWEFPRGEFLGGLVNKGKEKV